MACVLASCCIGLTYGPLIPTHIVIIKAICCAIGIIVIYLPPPVAGKLTKNCVNFVINVPLFTACDLLILQCLHSLDVALKKFHALMETNIQQERPSLSNIDYGMPLTDLVQKANNLFGKIIVSLYSFNIIVIIVFLFWAINDLGHYTSADGAFQPSTVISGLTAGFFCMFSGTKLYYIQTVGQELCDRYSTIRRKLLQLKFDLSRNCDGNVTDVSRIDVLIEQFSGTPITPMDIFNLNYASTATISGVGITYALVLLEFKQGGKE